MSAPPRRSVDSRAARAAPALYGSILTLVAIEAYSEDPGATSAEMLVAVLVTALVFWLAHAYVDLISEEAANPDDDEPFPRTAARALARQWPMVGATVAPGLALVLGVVGVLSRNGAVAAAIAIGIFSLFSWGVILARQRNFSTARVVLTGLGNVALGLVLVALKLLWH